jgi:hypothetical protein
VPRKGLSDQANNISEINILGTYLLLSVYHSDVPMSSAAEIDQPTIKEEVDGRRCPSHQ